MDLFKSLAVKLHVSGPAAAICFLGMCMVVVAVWGEGQLASSAMTGLMFAIGALLTQVRR